MRKFENSDIGSLRVDLGQSRRVEKKKWHKRIFNFKKGKGVTFSLDKRKRFIIGTLVLTFFLFFTESLFGESGIFISLPLSFITVLILWWASHKDIKDGKTYEVFILPFFFSLSFGLFYFLTPAAIFPRLLLTLIYAFGLYSVFLSQNILVISSAKTINLLSGARIVSFVTTLVSYFFLTNSAFALHEILFVLIPVVGIYTFFLIYHSLWTYNLQKLSSFKLWSAGLTLCLLEAAVMLWFWPSSPTVISLFMTGFFYSIVGLSHIWFERRLFKGVLWEYVWVGCIVFFVLILFTPWGN